MNSRRPFLGLSLALVVALIPVGCGNGLDLGRVTGVVTLDGQPVPNAFVVFTPKQAGRPSTTKTNAEGRFTLQFNASNKGALVGEHSVTVSTADITDDGKNIPELIPAMYNRKGSIDVTVESGANQINLELVTSK